jgi:hypothetical protein
MNSRDGSVSGARAYARSEGQENYDWAVILNSRDFVSEDEWSELVYNTLPDLWAANKIAEA